MTLPKFQITVETEAGTVSHVVRAADKRAAMARALLPYPGAMVVRADQLSSAQPDAPKVTRLKPADRARQEMIGMLQRQGYSLADISDALNISVDLAAALAEAA
ncbi:hypothetical protein [Paracoccus sp. (in: a-proteobacteria)]|uniref:hypothetical protein n=1 Tax=Paracoccus sp. TaxID=267 RepID=UPI0028A6E11F|nr:hypothetical protein [Paracoccus sp. (in: a-proteobacteria)]